jgi:hypothetical protein
MSGQGPFLENEYVTNNIIVVASWNESGTAEVSNCVHFVLLGGVVLTSMHGTNEFVYFNHGPALSTVLVNRGLASLGGWDCEASVLAPVTEKAHDININMVCDFVEWEKSYPGLLNRLTPIPPRYRLCSDTGSRCAAHNGTLESVESQWRKSTGTYEYAGLYPHDDGFRGTINGISAIGMQGAVGQPRTRPNESAQTNANANDTKTKSGSLEKLDVARPSLAGLVVGLAFMMLQ